MLRQARCRSPGKAACGGNDDRIGRQALVENAQHATLGQARAGQLDEVTQHGRVHVVVDFRDETFALILDRIKTVDLGVQFGTRRLWRIAPGSTVVTGLQRFAQRLQGELCISQHLHTIEFLHIERTDVDIEKLHIRVLE